jgi:hypothetical protein
MNSLIDCSDSAAAILIALASGRGNRICNGVSLAERDFMTRLLRAVVADAGVGVETVRASGVREVGLAMGRFLRGCMHVYMQA